MKKKTATPAAGKRQATAKPRRQAAEERTAPAISEDAIAMRAYELFIEQGGAHGRDLDHWLAAERELRQA